MESAEASAKHFNLVGGKDNVRICFPGRLQPLEEMPGKRSPSRWTPDADVAPAKKRKDGEASDSQADDVEGLGASARKERRPRKASAKLEAERKVHSTSQPMRPAELATKSEQRDSMASAQLSPLLAVSTFGHLELSVPAMDTLPTIPRVRTSTSDDGRLIIDVDSAPDGARDRVPDQGTACSGSSENLEEKKLLIELE
eukprot:scaffold133_cov257-Pinguiococcus_pyrenoidosus.AAC.30